MTNDTETSGPGDDQSADGAERIVVYHPSDDSAGLAVRFDPDPGPVGTEFTVEQLWPNGTAEPIYVGDELRVSGLIEALSQALQISQEARLSEGGVDAE